MGEPMTRIGELFAGYGGLGMGVQSVIGGQIIWFSEIDPAPSKILAHHFPAVPNLGDITQIDWSTVESVDVLTGGFPCQDVSLAGARAGLSEGTRSGLWSEFARAISVLRPSLVVIENVRGLLSAKAGDMEEWSDEEVSGMESGAVGVGDTARSGGSVLNAFGSVLGDLALLGFDAEWVGVRASDVGAPHQRFRVFIVAQPADSERLRFGEGGYSASGEKVGGWASAVVGGSGGTRVPEADSVDLLPTTSTMVANDGEQPDTWHERAARVKENSGANNGIPLTIAALMLPTPKASDGEWSNPPTPGRPVEDATHLQTITGLLPTAQAHDATQGKTAAQVDAMRSRGHGVSNLNEIQFAMLPTVVAAEGTKATTRQGVAQKSETGQVWLTNVAHDLNRPSELGPVEQYEALWDALEDQSPFWHTDTKDYWPAIQRWAKVMGRKAPAPTIPDGKNGRFRLNPKFTEWMMGLPAGWVTGVGLTRNEALKACGNGVVWQQAAYALTILLPRLAVAA